MQRQQQTTVADLEKRSFVAFDAY